MASHVSRFLPPDRLVADGFVIRSYRPGDGVALAEAINASYSHLRRFLKWTKPHQTEIEAELFCRNTRGRYLLREDFTLGVFSAAEDRVFGGTGFHLRNRPLTSCYAEIGMWIRADLAGQGLGTRVLTAMLEWGFSEWPWERLEWRCDLDNVPSQRVAQKAGMRLEGTLRGDTTSEGCRRDTLIFGILRDDWMRSG